MNLTIFKQIDPSLKQLMIACKVKPEASNQRDSETLSVSSLLSAASAAIL
jgi:hypothetical protein